MTYSPNGICKFKVTQKKENIRLWCCTRPPKTFPAEFQVSPALHLMRSKQDMAENHFDIVVTINECGVQLTDYGTIRLQSGYILEEKMCHFMNWAHN